jgi:hypothetical protein
LSWALSFLVYCCRSLHGAGLDRFPLVASFRARRIQIFPERREGGHVEVVLIDKFVVPEESKVAFLTEVRKSSTSLRRCRDSWRVLSMKARMAEAAITL